MQWKSRLTADWLPSDPIMSRLFMDFSQIPQTPKKIWWRVSKPRRKPWNLSGRHHRANNRHNLFKKATIKSLCPSADLSRVLLCEIPTCFRPHPHPQTHRQSGTELCALVNKQLPFSSTLLRSSQVTPKPKIPLYLSLLYLVLYQRAGMLLQRLAHWNDMIPIRQRGAVWVRATWSCIWTTQLGKYTQGSRSSSRWVCMWMCVWWMS